MSLTKAVGFEQCKKCKSAQSRCKRDCHSLVLLDKSQRGRDDCIFKSVLQSTKLMAECSHALETDERVEEEQVEEKPWFTKFDGELSAGEDAGGGQGKPPLPLLVEEYADIFQDRPPGLPPTDGPLVTHYR